MKEDKRVRGCMTPDCAIHRSKKLLKYDMLYCKSCGNPTVPMCKTKGCYTPITEEDWHKTICEKCEIEKQEKRDKIVDLAKKAPKAIPAAVAPLANPEIRNKAIAVAKQAVPAAKQVAKVAFKIIPK